VLAIPTPQNNTKKPLHLAGLSPFLTQFQAEDPLKSCFYHFTKTCEPK